MKVLFQRLMTVFAIAVLLSLLWTKHCAFAQQTLVHDANGNLISKTDANGTTTYTYDARNRLIAVNGPGVTATFTYDALGRRNSKTVNGVSSQYLHDGADIVQEVSGGAVSAMYLRGLNVDEPFVRQSSWVEYYHTDALGSVLALSNSSGVPVTSYAYEPFGKNSVSGTSANPFQFTGRENDGTGLYYYRARYYSPQLQRFLTEDPLEFAAGDMNLYAYVWNSPTNYTDQFGLAVVYPGPVPPGCEPLGQRKSFTQRLIRNVGCASNFLPAGGMVVGGRAMGGAARTLDELSNAARAADRNNLTKAGRSLQKHADRQGSAFEATSKKAGDLNRQGQEVADDILTNPGSVRKPNRLGGEDVIAPDGRGMRYNSDGSFRSFLEPK